MAPGPGGAGGTSPGKAAGGRRKPSECNPCVWTLLAGLVGAVVAGVVLVAKLIPGPRRHWPFKLHAKSAGAAGPTVGPNGELKSPEIEAYLRWLAEGKSKVDGLYFKMFDKPGVGRKVRGMACRLDLEDGDLVMEISRKNRLYAGSPEVTSEARFNGLSLPSSQVGFFLAEELLKIRRGEHSYWRPYIDMLPTYEDYAQYHPLAASPEIAHDFNDLCVFSSSDLRCSNFPVLHYWETMDRDYALYRELGGTLLDKNDKKAWQAIRWAYIVCLSRRFHLEGEPTLVPLADNLNTGPEALKNVAWSSEPARRDGTDFFRMTAHGATRAGEELLDSYGSKSNARMLLVYGFVLPENPEPAEQYSRPACEKLLGGVGLRVGDSSPRELIKNLIRISCQSCELHARDLVEKQTACSPWRRPAPSASASWAMVQRKCSPRTPAAGLRRPRRGRPGRPALLAGRGGGGEEEEDREEAATGGGPEGC